MSATSIQGVPGSRILVKPTPTEATIADVAWDSLTEVDTQIIRRMIDPMTCPAEFLPYLAWSLSVDVWDPLWDDTMKRAIIAASPEAHRIKGTPLALKNALALIGYDSSIEEWWQSIPEQRRGTFKVRINRQISDGTFSIERLRLIGDTIRRTKPKSRVFSLEIPLDVELPVVIGATNYSVRDTIMYPHQCWQSSYGPVNVNGYIRSSLEIEIRPPSQFNQIGTLECDLFVGAFLDVAPRGQSLYPPGVVGAVITTEADLYPTGFMGLTSREIVINPIAASDEIGRNCEAGFIFTPIPDQLDTPIYIGGFFITMVRPIEIAPMK